MLSSSGASVVRRHSSLVAGQDLSFYSYTHLLRQPSILTKSIERPATKQAAVARFINISDAVNV